MFREMRRFKQQVSDEECRRILSEEKRAAFSVIGEGGYPYTIPINFYYDPETNRIYFHGARQGHKVDAMKACDQVCLTTWNQGFKKEGRWEWNATSVVVFGRVHEVEDIEVKKVQLRKMGEKYYPNQEELDEEMNSESFDHAAFFEIEIEHMTGKLVNER